MKQAITLFMFLPLLIGFLVGLLVSPFVIGFQTAYEFLADHMDQISARHKTKQGAH